MRRRLGMIGGIAAQPLGGPAILTLLLLDGIGTLGAAMN